MSALALEAYRFSVAWPRVQPEGKGRPNAKGLDHYERFVDALLAAGIVPYLTLYHWDLPSTLAERGGWLSRDTAKRFAEYAQVVARRLGARVRNYATLNEPRCSAFVGYSEGRHAPGLRDRKKALQALHHLLLAHGLGMEALRSLSLGSDLGIVLDVKPYYPADDTPEAALAARECDAYFNAWTFDALFKGGYPRVALEGYGAEAPAVEVDDARIIAAGAASVGINYYTRGLVAFDPAKPFPRGTEVKRTGAEYTEMDWEVFPDGLRATLERLRADYPGIGSFYVAENGAAFADELVEGQGGPRVDDPRRREYYKTHLEAVSRAAAAGVPIEAYLAWSLMDNFEWGRGYTKRFGICYVDYPSLRRVPKASALWYRDFIRGTAST